MAFFDFREPVSAWTHFLWMWLAIPGTVILWRRSRGDRVKQVSLLIFGVALIFCYLGSTLFHGLHVPRYARTLWKLDHVGIYLLIAGSFTPAVVVLLGGWWRWSMLGMIWLLAVAGISMRLLASNISPSLSTGLYLLMGWSAILCYFELARTVSHRAMRLVVLGGVLYSIGALINLMNWPSLAPRVFGPHELMHLFVMGGSLTHFWFMLTQVVPFERCRKGRHGKGFRWANGPIGPLTPFLAEE
jgi:hemolysin III